MRLRAIGRTTVLNVGQFRLKRLDLNTIVLKKVYRDPNLGLSRVLSDPETYGVNCSFNLAAKCDCA